MTSHIWQIVFWVFCLAITTGLGALAYFIKKEFADLNQNIRENAEALSDQRRETDEKLEQTRRDLEDKIEAERKRISDLKEDLPFVYTTREDFIRFANGVDSKMGSIDSKIDKILEKMNRGSSEANG